MYSNCIFCFEALGQNEAVESFPVGRRLAFDAARGRLWVVCHRCERWNLSPQEERWEAIEACERLYHDTRLRVATENIGLARLHEGLELVRIGRPPRPEFAGWRYGDQFGRRRRRHLLTAAAGVGGVSALLVGGWVAGFSLASASGVLFQVVRKAVAGDPDTLVAPVTLPNGETVRILRRDLDLELHPLPPARAGQHGVQPAWQLTFWNDGKRIDLVGSEALQALGRALPHINRYGGSAKQVQQAVRYLEGLHDPLDAFGTLAESIRRNAPSWNLDRYRIRSFSPVLRLALEMAAHEEAERQAIEGELTLLERAWKEAEEIAAIADRLAIPPRVEKLLGLFKRQSSSRSAEPGAAVERAP